MYAEIAWVLVSSGTQAQPQVILDPDYLPDYLPFLITMVIFIIKKMFYNVVRTSYQVRY